MAKQQWVREKEAMEALGYKNPRRMRTLVKQGTLDISYRTFRGRSYEYDMKAIERIKNLEARIVA